MSPDPIRQQFLQNCRDIVRGQNDVTINATALDAFAKTLKASSFTPDWNEYISEHLRSGSCQLVQVFYELAMITAQQGGFIDVDAQGQSYKWNINGSGARAMVETMEAIRDARALPFFDITADDVDARIRPILEKLNAPFIDQRIAIFKEFADPDKFISVTLLLNRAVTNPSKDGNHYKIDMDFVTKLGDIFPIGLGEDPLLKKAILTCLMAAAHVSHRGHTMDVSSLPIASDYILPQVLNADHVGVLNFSEGLTKTLTQKDLLPEADKRVEALRAATVVACAELAEKTGLGPQDIDANLWMAGRKLQNARPHMMCKTMRF